MRRVAEKRVIKQERAQETRKEILSSAISLFAKRGILATTMAELARAIHMTPGALYWHFPTKEDLLLAAVEELHTRYVQHYAPLILEARQYSATKQFDLFFDHTFNFLEKNREHGIFFGLVGAESAENDDAVAQALRDALAVYVEAFAGIVRYGQKKGEFRLDVDPITVGRAVFFGEIGIITQHNLHRNQLEYLPMARALKDLLVAGIKVQPR